MTVGKARLEVPEILPVLEGMKRPFWSVMIPTYNCASFLVHTLRSVLAQDPGSERMHIEVVDDCSTKDDPESVVQELGKGRVQFFRRPQNGGAIANFNTCLERSLGQWVHILHGDDMVIPGFYERIGWAAEQEPTIGAAFCRHIYVNEQGEWQALSSQHMLQPGILPNWIERIAVSQQLETPSIAVKREVYEKLGGFHPELFHAADWEMWRRIAAFYPVWYEPQPLAYYRVHSSADTSRLIQTGSNIANIRRSIEIVQSYLPEAVATELSDDARRNYALAGINLARRMLARQNQDAAVALTWESIQCSDRPEVIEALMQLLTMTPAEPFLTALKDRAAVHPEDHPEDTVSRSVLNQLQQKLNALIAAANTPVVRSVPTILIDGVFFQLFKTGIARLWRSLLEVWAANGFAQYLIVLDRNGTAPKLPGLRYRWTDGYDVENLDSDRAMLQEICDQEAADLFISTYYTTPQSTPSVFMAYDMIPEIMGSDPHHVYWRGKHHAIQYASAYIAISKNTAQDLLKLFPHIPSEKVTVAYPGVDSVFAPASFEAIAQFKSKYGIHKPYFILASPGHGHKNGLLFFEAFSKLPNKEGFEVVCTGTAYPLLPEFRMRTAGTTVHTLSFEDAELTTAYAGAIALVYPSQYEGFGLPIVEAMASGCPVITCPNASIPEVAGEAALYVEDWDVMGMANALCEVQKPQIREALITQGLEQVAQFSWVTMAEQVSEVLIDATLRRLNLRTLNILICPDWQQSEATLYQELGRVMQALASHPQKDQITLLVATEDVSEEDAGLLISGVTMDLLTEEELDVTDGPEISFLGELSSLQWQALIKQLSARLILKFENLTENLKSHLTDLPALSLEEFLQ